MTKNKSNTSLTEYTEPPVVEAWIEFDFDLSEEENIPWTEEVATNFFQENLQDFSAKHFQYYARIEANSKGEPDLSKIDKQFSRVKAFSKDEQYCIQAGRNFLVFNQINIGNWLGYPNMRDKAFETLDIYSKYRGIDKLLGSCLHYRDQIDIPSKGKKIELEDYFKIYPHLDDSLGDMSHFKLELVLPDLCEESVCLFTLLSLPGNNEKKFKFQMDWDIKPTMSGIKTSMNFDDTKIWLDKVHSSLRENFDNNTFTDKTIELFNTKRRK